MKSIARKFKGVEVIDSNLFPSNPNLKNKLNLSKKNFALSKNLIIKNTQCKNQNKKEGFLTMKKVRNGKNFIPQENPNLKKKKKRLKIRKNKVILKFI